MSLNIFSDLMTHKIQLRKRNRNVSGDFYDVLVIPNLDAFVQYGNKLVTNSKDEEVTSTALIFLKNDCGIDINWEYWIIDQVLPYSRPNMEVIKIDPVDSPINGKTHHFEVFVK